MKDDTTDFFTLRTKSVSSGRLQTKCNWYFENMHMYIRNWNIILKLKLGKNRWLCSHSKQTRTSRRIQMQTIPHLIEEQQSNRTIKTIKWCLNRIDLHLNNAIWLILQISIVRISNIKQNKITREWIGMDSSALMRIRSYSIALK